MLPLCEAEVLPTSAQPEVSRGPVSRGLHIRAVA